MARSALANRSLEEVGRDGAIAQLGERLLCKQEVVGSIPSGSTRPKGPAGLSSNVEEYAFAAIQAAVFLTS